MSRGIVAIVVGTLVLLAAGCGGGGGSGAANSPADAAQEESAPAPEQRCADAWNDASNDQVRSFLNVVGQGQSIRYVSVGFAADYPDLCLITASNPDAGLAMQFLESEQSAFGYKPSSGGPISSNNLDPSLTDWNASADAEGYVTLYGG